MRYASFPVLILIPVLMLTFPPPGAAKESGFRLSEVIEVLTPGSPPFLSPLANFDGDEIPDFVTGRSLYLGLGDGTFRAIEISDEPLGATGVGDVDGDGAPDLLVISPSWRSAPRLGPGPPRELQIRLNRGLDFPVFRSYAHDPDAVSPLEAPLLTGFGALADVDRDGFSDVVVFGRVVTEEVGSWGRPFHRRNPALLVGRGPEPGAFEDFELHYPAVRLTPEGLAIEGNGSRTTGLPTVADLNGDGYPDVVTHLVNDMFVGWVTVLLNDGSGGFGEPRAYATLPPADFHEPRPKSVSVWDADGDGNLDLLVGHWKVFAFSLLRNRGDGSFETGIPFVVGPSLDPAHSHLSLTPYFVEAGDFNDDGKTDAVLVTSADVELFFSFGEPDGGVRTLVLGSASGGSGRTEVQSGDLDGDGLTDLILAGSECDFGSRPCTVVVLLGTPSARFLRGDANADGEVNLSDALAILGYLFLGERGPPCLDAADGDDSGRVEVTDAVYVLGFLFLGGPEPPPPFGRAGVDETLDSIICLP